MIENQQQLTKLFVIHKVLGTHPHKNWIQMVGWHDWGSTYIITTVSWKKG